jgi:hypothetical protein
LKVLEGGYRDEGFPQLWDYENKKKDLGKIIQVAFHDMVFW